MHLIDGRKISDDIVAELAQDVAALPAGSRPCIHLVRVGEDPASVSYVRKKQQTAEKLGMEGRLTVLPETATEAELHAVLDRLNADPTVHGILVQSPLPAHMNERDAFNRLDPAKDVDGLGVINMGRLVQDDDSGFYPCTPSGIVELLRRTGIQTDGKHVVVVGRSQLVGKPAGLLMLQKGPFANATVTICHSRTKNLESITRQADILIAAIGRPRFITSKMVRPGAVVIDVGINRVEDPTKKSGYKLVGDVDFDAVAPIAEAITPAPGGVGPMTVTMLMRNTLEAFRRATQIQTPS